MSPLRCDVCGRYIAYRESGAASRELITPDSEFTREIYETLCASHKQESIYSMLEELSDARKLFATKDDLLDALKIALGHYSVWRIGEREVLRPKSISFAAMDQAAFSAFYDRTVQLIVVNLLPGTDRADLDARVHEILDGRSEQGEAA